MVFSSLTFLYIFLPATLLLYFIAPAKIRNIVLFAASLIFYFCGERIYLLLMLGEILLSYLAGLLLSRTDGGRKRAALIVFLVLSFGMLGLFKYADLFTGTVNAIAGKELLSALRLHMPIGISFYVFQSVSYGIDVYRGKYEAEKNPLRLATYISLFPQLIAGPIVRYDELSKDLRKRQISFRGFGDGAFRFVLGLGKKVLIADRLFALCTAAGQTTEPSFVLAWTEAAAFLLYVYFDFSGYSDMAIGLGACFGFKIPENFRYPLVSGSVKEFWRRWHITLGAWFRDYLYIPLGGNRRGLARQIFALLFVWAMTGLWHGASWNYVIWGACFGILLVFETVFSRLRGEKGEKKEKAALWRSLPRRVAVFLITALIFVWFRFQSAGQAAQQLGRMFGSAPFWSGGSAYPLRGGAVILAAALFGCTPLPKMIARRLEQTKAGAYIAPVARGLWMAAILALSTAYLVDGSFSPFLYFRF